MDSDDYHDYVIRDGELIGRFEEMYENCDNPWHQDEGGHLKEQIALLMLRDAGREYQSVLDLGCGKGRFTKLLIDAVGPELAMGTDISPTALSVASDRNRNVDFVAAEIPPIAVADNSYDLVVASEVFWYVLPSLEAVFREIDRVLVDDGLLLTLLYFPDDQQYGNEVMNSPADFRTLLPFDSEKTIVINNGGQQPIDLYRV
jgi:SAM-dependent methyltransferase